MLEVIAWVFVLICLYFACFAGGWLRGESYGRREERAHQEYLENTKGYTIYCEQTKWRLKLADTIEVIENV